MFHPSVKQIFRRVFNEPMEALRVYVVRDDLRKKEIILQLCLLKEIKQEIKIMNIHLAKISGLEPNDEGN